MAKSYYLTDEWKDLREMAFNRDGRTCKSCGKKEGAVWLAIPPRRVNLVAHHIVPRSSSGEDKLSNLLTMCRSCHSKLPQTDHHKKRISEGMKGRRK